MSTLNIPETANFQVKEFGFAKAWIGLAALCFQDSDVSSRLLCVFNPGHQQCLRHPGDSQCSAQLLPLGHVARRHPDRVQRVFTEF